MTSCYLISQVGTIHHIRDPHLLAIHSQLMGLDIWSDHWRRSPESHGLVRWMERRSIA